MIVLEKISKTLGGKAVLKDLDLHIPRGRISVILGPSGEGKTVLMKIMIGLLRPDAGRVMVDGKDLGSLGPRAMNDFRKRFGMLFQSGALFDSMTVRENIAFPLREHARLTPERIEAKVREKLGLVGLAEAIDKMPSELSGGMRKRVGLARAIALEPAIILYDEPTTGLDPLMTDAINRLIVDMQKKLGITSIIISHDIESTFEVADFVAMLHEGRIIGQGTPEEFRKLPHPFIARFLAGRAA